MPRSYSITVPGRYRIKMNGTLLTEGATDSRFEQLFRQDIVRSNVEDDGFRIPLPYSMSYIHEQYPRGSWNVTQYSRAYEYSGNLVNYANHLDWPGRVLPDVSPAVANSLVIRCLNDLKDQKVNAAVALAEYQQTADLFASNAHRCIRAYKLARKGRWKRAFRELRHTPQKGWDRKASSRVLEFQYGVRPLLGDIYGSMEALAEKRHGPTVGSYFAVKARCKTDPTRSSATRGTYAGDYLPVTITYSTSYEVQVKLWFSMKNDMLKTVSEMGITNPLALIWEKLPFSFVLDWLWPIGDWLNALDAHWGLIYRGGFNTLWRTVETRYSGLKSERNGISNVTGSYVSRSMNRAIYQQVPFPHPPEIKSPLGLERALNAIALIGALRK